MGVNVRSYVRKLLHEAVSLAVSEHQLERVPADLPFERPKRPEHGDFSTSLALMLAKPLKKAPRLIADMLVGYLRKVGGSDLAEVNIANPGFINLRFSDAFWQARLLEICAAGDSWGRGEKRAHPKLCIEYISANPTGPLHFAHGRHAAVGDSLTKLLRFTGYDVIREFYINDAGNQVAMLAHSVWARYMEIAGTKIANVPVIAFPENGYKGAYIRSIGQALFAKEGNRFIAPEVPQNIEEIRQFAIDQCLEMIRGTLTKFGVEFDVWQSERALHTAGEVTGTLEVLDKAGFIDRHDDAVWLRTTMLWGDEKDRVVVKSDGLPTYLLADIAYHRKKIARGFDQLVDIWGSDHHGHIPRMQAALKALGQDPAQLNVILIQMVSLLRDGVPVAMGKREGEFVTLDAVIDEVGLDATRFFYLMRRHDTPLEFDLELAKRQSMDNPVYYAQYAHARCSSLLRRAKELEVPDFPRDVSLVAHLNLPEEIAILRRLAEFPDYLEDAAKAQEPHRLVQYVLELVGDFQSYYTRLQKVHGDTILPQQSQRIEKWRDHWNWEKTAARLLWVEAIRQVIAITLFLLGVSAPNEMKRAEAHDDSVEVS